MREFIHSFPPGLVLIIAALIVALPFVRGMAKPLIALLSAIGCCVLVALAYCLNIGDAAAPITLIAGVDGSSSVEALFLVESGLQLTWMQINGPTHIFATIFSLMACVGILYAFQQRRTVEMCGALLYAGSAICAVYAGDLMTLFIFWELMAVGSTLIIMDGRQKDSARASLRYVAVHFVGGVILMVGIIWYALLQGDFTIYADPLQSPLVQFNSMLAHPAAWLMLIGILINAGAPILGSWLPDAYPEASPSGTVFLSAYTTKTAVFVLIMLFAGTNFLIYVGMAMAAYGVIYALLENDMRRILAYSIINQVGFMLCAIGIGSELALCGASAHAFAHILYKALLLMSAGSVLYMTNQRQLTSLGGLHKSMRWTMIFAMIGAFTMLMPLAAGFTSKSMITSALSELAAFGGQYSSLYIAAWMVLVAASAGVFINAGCRYIWFVFFHKDSGLRPKGPPKTMFAAMAIFATLCIAFGIPKVSQHTIYKILPYTPMKMNYGQHPDLSVPATAQTLAQVDIVSSDLYKKVERIPYSTWSAHHIITQCTLVLATVLAFFLLVNKLRPRAGITLDSDYLYRRLLPQLWQSALMPIFGYIGIVHGWILGKLPGKVTQLVQTERIEHCFSQDVEIGGSHIELRLDIRSNRMRQWAVGGALVVILAILLLYVIFVIWQG